ncbi:MAG: DUF1080 domain-containing protein [Chitinophagaceae bacterium]
MYKIYALVVVATFIGCSTAKNTSMNTETNILTEEERRDGWQLLFDGQTPNGWHSYGKSGIGRGWKAVDNTLYLDPAEKDGGDIVTNDEFENFHLKLEWKISPKGNSGIMFNVKEDPAKYQSTYHTGPEMQILDNAGHSDAVISKHSAGDLYDLIAVSKKTVKPAGEWNAVEIRLNRGKLDFYMNGEHVINTTMWTDDWRRMVTNSKFKEWPDFSTYRQGKIALQDHGDKVWFRNIKIRRI